MSRANEPVAKPKTMPPTKPELEQQLETAADQTQGSQTEIKIEVGDTEITFNCVTEFDTNTKSSNVIAYTAENEFNLEVGSLIETLSTNFANLLHIWSFVKNY